MARLTYNNRNLGESPLEIELNILGLERPGSDEVSEKWVKYSLFLRSGDEAMAAITGVISELDLNTMLSSFSTIKRKNMHFEPIEPDFLIDASQDNGTATVCVFVDEGIRRGEVAYAGRAFGLRVVVTDHALQQFAEGLAAEIKRVGAA